MINQLHLFAKDTSATATEKGFQFQRLKTLETWLVNRLEGREEMIYCDYQEDIFTVNATQGIIRFQQVKLYASHFSFRSREIRQTIFNFFLLWNKYANDSSNITCCFITNTKISRKVKGNDAVLLAQWHQQQEALSEPLLLQCSQLIKRVVIGMAEDTLSKKDSLTAVDPAYHMALEECRRLPERVWEQFTRSVRWDFAGEEPDVTMGKITKRIMELINKLPLNIDKEKVNSHLSLLHFEIARCTACSDPKERVLTNVGIDLLLLQEGDLTSRWYAQALQSIFLTPLHGFYPDAFYELFRALRYFGRHLAYSGHEVYWTQVLHKYMLLEDLPVAFRRKTIFLHVWLLRASWAPDRVWIRAMHAWKDWIQYYFDHFPAIYDEEQAKDDPTMIENLRSVQPIIFKLFPEGQLEQWTAIVETHARKKLQEAAPGDATCRAAEVMGYCVFGSALGEPKDMRIRKALAIHQPITRQLELAQTFDPNDLIMMYQFFAADLIKAALDDPGLMQEIDELLDALDRFAAAKDLQTEAGNKLVERAWQYLERKKYLEGLDALFKAVDSFLQHNTKDHLSDTLLRISNVYGSLNLYYLSKKFALAALHVLEYFGRKAEHYFLSDALSWRFKADFRQGQWLSALLSFTPYLVARELADTKENNERTANRKEDLEMCLHYMAIILVALPRLNPTVQALFQKKQEWIEKNIPRFATEYLHPVAADMDAATQPALYLKDYISASPLSEIGPVKHIRLRMVGIDWLVQADNNYLYNAVLEDFVAFLQGILWGFGAYGIDLHLQILTVIIQIKASNEDSFELAKAIPLMRIWWLHARPLSSDDIDDEGLSEHYTFLLTGIRHILSSVSLLPSAVFNTRFDQLVQHHHWLLKLTTVSGYQQMYKFADEQVAFDAQHRHALSPIKPPVEIFDLTPLIFDLRQVLSPQFNEATVLMAIEKFYHVTLEHLSLSINHWMQEPLFHSCLKTWRNYRWLDWQILLALENFVLDQKANALVLEMNLENDEEAMKAVENEVLRLMDLPETDTYRNIPVEQLDSDLFRFYLTKTAVRPEVLAMYGLQSAGRTFEMMEVLIFLRSRCRFDAIDLSHLSPFPQSSTRSPGSTNKIET